MKNYYFNWNKYLIVTIFVLKENKVVVYHSKIPTPQFSFWISFLDSILTASILNFKSHLLHLWDFFHSIKQSSFKPSRSRLTVTKQHQLLRWTNNIENEPPGGRFCLLLIVGCHHRESKTVRTICYTSDGKSNGSVGCRVGVGKICILRRGIRCKNKQLPWCFELVHSMLVADFSPWDL